ncbi:MAG: class B sortase [Solobacterium sp.]|nr:class B sortase [Solobacterium sp.]
MTEAKTRKKLSKTGKRVMDIILVISLLVAIFSGYKLITGLRTYEEAKKAYGTIRDEVVVVKDVETSEDNAEQKPAEREINWEKLWDVSKDVVGWIHMDDSSIDYPVVHYTDNDYYLRRLLDGTWNDAGTIFVEAENKKNFEDQVTVIYGHHMLNQPYMFREIESFGDPAYYETHKVIEFETPDKKYYLYPIAGIYETAYADYVKQNFENEDECKAYIDDFVSRSTFKGEETLQPTDKMVVLSTCEYKVHSVDGRFALLTKLVEAKEGE